MDRIYSIELAEGAASTGLPEMLKELLAQNLEQRPEKLEDFLKLKIRVGLTVRDAGVQLTLAFDRGRLVIHSGLERRPHIRVESDSGMIMALANQSIRWGLPYYFDETGKEIWRAIRSGRLKVGGMMRHLPSLVRFSRIMSVR